jgi:hypothetical protein
MATWTPQSRNSASWSGQSRNSSVFTNISKTAITIGYLLLESGDRLLQEDSFSLLLEDATSTTSASWANLTKN